jgi:hypothetical protein
MEVRVIQRLKSGDKMPPAPAMHLLESDQPWEDYYGTLGAILDQDMANIPHVHAGLKSAKKRDVHLSNYQEVRVRHFHQTLDKYLDIYPIS